MICGDIYNQLCWNLSLRWFCRGSLNSRTTHSPHRHVIRFCLNSAKYLDNETA